MLKHLWCEKISSHEFNLWWKRVYSHLRDNMIKLKTVGTIQIGYILLRQTGWQQV